MLAILAMLFRRLPSAADDARFEALFRRHYPQVEAFFRRRGCPRDERSDLAQETFLRAYDRRSSYRGEANELTWLLAIATNLWLNRCREGAAAKRSAQVVSLDGEAPPVVPTASRQADDAVAAEQALLLRTAIDALTPAMRRCVKLRVYQDKSYREIAAILGIREVTAKSQVSRARTILRATLADHFPELRSDSELE